MHHNRKRCTKSRLDRRQSEGGIYEFLSFQSAPERLQSVKSQRGNFMNPLQAGDYPVTPKAQCTIRSLFLHCLALAHVDLGELLKVGGEQFGSTDVISHVNLFVLRVSAVVGGAHR